MSHAQVVLTSRPCCSQAVQLRTSNRLVRCRPHTCRHLVHCEIQQLPSEPVFQPFRGQNAARDQLVEYRRHFRTKSNQPVLIQPLTLHWVPDCAQLLTDAFAEAMDYLPMYKRFLYKQIEHYLTRHVDMPPKCCVLVAIMQPSEEDSGTSSSEGLLKPGKLVGTVEMSFAPSTRTRHLTLNAPEHCSYLCNMATDAEHQRCGIAFEMLQAAEDLALIAGEPEIFLHLRLKDEVPARLYKKGGFQSIKQDPFWIRLFGQDRRLLLRLQARQKPPDIV